MPKQTKLKVEQEQRLSIELKQSIKLKCSMPWVRRDFGNLLHGEALRATDDLLRGKERTFGGGAGGTAGLPKYFCLTQLFSLSLSKTMFYHFCICHISETLASQLFGQRSSGRFLGLRGSHGTPLLVHGLVGISPSARKLWVTYL